ncbi:hypothetical protein [Fructilactobacillus sanfranciscensis]|uniref:hypothetical protein n=1 Tax=Fructilactobacillus sanfranciscensis TaxID=1625 RepID=UPI000CD45FAF|nr:hypothetical protein [Fructilactobacillus sanfranciscensis]POH18622.1 hypothetical protein BGL45_06685 [Fructilactobacillus sanfranciscensis]
MRKRKIKLSSNIASPRELKGIIGGFMYRDHHCYVGYHDLGNSVSPETPFPDMASPTKWYCGYMSVDHAITEGDELNINCNGGVVQLHREGLDYNPYAETFNSMTKRLGLRNLSYSNKRRYLKEDIDLAIKKLHKKRLFT